MTRTATRLVACLGNPHRGDDAFGAHVADRLRRDADCRAEIVTHRGDGLALIELWSGRPHVIVVDAIVCARPVGTLLHFDVSRRCPPDELTATSTHALGADAAIELARTLGRLPERVDIVAACAGGFEPGTPLCPEVARQVEVAADWVRALFRGERPAATTAA